ncbi:MAG: CapA family protein [Ruminococcus sp.]|nr:CapA family protein [Ruminococcus sp.]
MMKKFLVLIVAALTLCGCSQETASGNTDSTASDEVENSTTAAQSVVKTSSKDTSDDDSKSDEQRVSFCAVGDNLIHETIYKEADGYSGEDGDGKYDFTSFYSEIRSDIESYDLAFVNQETIVGGYDLGLSGYPLFNSPFEVAEALKDTGFDMVNLATNHALDVGQEGIDNAVSIFDELNLCHDGIYSGEDEQNAVSIIERNGIKFSLVSFTESTNGLTAPNSYSVSTFDDDEYIKQKIQNAKAVSAVVVVSAHWGEENSFETDDFQTNYAQYLADCGADIIVGTHPHVIQPVEWIEASDGRQVLCAYSLGNFLGGMLLDDNSLSGLLSLDVVKSSEGIKIENVHWTPLVIHFEGNQSNIESERYGYKIYKLSDYTDELADKHVLNGYNGNSISIEDFESQTQSVIAAEFLS